MSILKVNSIQPLEGETSVELNNVKITGPLNISGSVVTGSLNLNGSTSIRGSLTVSGSNTLTNIGPAKFVGNLILGSGTSITSSGFVNGAIMNNSASRYSFAMGNQTSASGDYSHTEGNYTKAIGTYSHAEGGSAIANGPYSHAEGSGSIASGSYSHTEGRGTRTIGNYAHAEGQSTQAIGNVSHTEGLSTQAIGEYSHAEGLATITSGAYQHVQGKYNLPSSTEAAFIIGNGTKDDTRKNLVFAAGNDFQISGSLFISGAVQSSGSNHVLTYNTSTGLVTYTASSAIGGGGSGSTSPGGSNTQIQYNANGTFAGTSSFAFIYNSQSLQQGNRVTASGLFSHAEGELSIASGSYSHAEGGATLAIGPASHAEGASAQAIGTYSHAEGYDTRAIGQFSHAEGYETVAIGDSSHAGGRNTIASGSTIIEGQTVFGSFNAQNNTSSIFIVGIGLNEIDRKDGFTVDVDLLGSGSIKIPTNAANPSSPKAGTMYFNTGNNKLYIYNGTTWKTYAPEP
jgi:hypothetical protein